jgi:hypothetical protein
MNRRLPKREKLSEDSSSSSDSDSDIEPQITHYSTRKRYDKRSSSDEKGNEKRYQKEKVVKRKPSNSDSNDNTKKKELMEAKMNDTVPLNKQRTKAPSKDKGKNSTKVEQHSGKITPSKSDICKLEANIRKKEETKEFSSVRSLNGWILKAVKNIEVSNIKYKQVVY